MKRILLVLLTLVAIAGLSLAAFTVVDATRNPPSRVTVVNQMDEAAAVVVEACGKAVIDQKLGSRERKTVALPQGDCHYNVAVEFASDKRRFYEGGYIASGIVFDDELRIAAIRVALVSCTMGGSYSEAMSERRCSEEFELASHHGPLNHAHTVKP